MDSNSASTLPIIDFAPYNIDVNESDVTTDDFASLADKLYTAFTTIGFVYLKNHGIRADKV